MEQNSPKIQWLRTVLCLDPDPGRPKWSFPPQKMKIFIIYFGRAWSFLGGLGRVLLQLASPLCRFKKKVNAFFWREAFRGFGKSTTNFAAFAPFLQSTTKNCELTSSLLTTSCKHITYKSELHHFWRITKYWCKYFRLRTALQIQHWSGFNHVI